MSYTLTPGLPVQLLGTGTTGVTTGTGGTLYLAGNCERVTVVVQGVGPAITTGALAIEEAFYNVTEPNAGTTAIAPPAIWSNIQTITGTAASSGAQQIVHVAGSVWAIRPRITVAMTTGVTVWAWGN